MGIPPILLLIGTLAGGFATFLAVRSILVSIFNSESAPLSWAESEAPSKSKSGIIRIFRPMVHRIVLPMISRYKLKEYKERIRRDLGSAGLMGELNADEFVGFQVFLGIGMPALILVLDLLFDAGFPIWLLFVFAAVGWMYPTLFVRDEKTKRRSQIASDMPFVVDLLALSTEAGLDFIGAIQKIVDKMATGPMAEELGQVLRDLKLGRSRADALNDFAWRLNMSEVSSFIAVLVTADSMGASIGGVLRQQSEQMRQERFTRAEKAGAQASQKIYFPLIVFILPAILLMVFGPVILQFMGGGF